MCTWPDRTKAYSETALCAGLLHPPTTAPSCRRDTNTSLRVARVHASVHPSRDPWREIFGRGFNGFQNRPSFVRLGSLWDSILVASLSSLSLSLEQLAAFIAQRFREIVCHEFGGDRPILTRSRYLDLRTRNGNDRSR